MNNCSGKTSSSSSGRRLAQLGSKTSRTLRSRTTILIATRTTLAAVEPQMPTNVHIQTKQKSTDPNLRVRCDSAGRPRTRSRNDARHVLTYLYHEGLQYRRHVARRRLISVPRQPAEEVVEFYRRGKELLIWVGFGNKTERIRQGGVLYCLLARPNKSKPVSQVRVGHVGNESQQRTASSRKLQKVLVKSRRKKGCFYSWTGRKGIVAKRILTSSAAQAPAPV